MPSAFVADDHSLDPWSIGPGGPGVARGRTTPGMPTHPALPLPRAGAPGVRPRTLRGRDGGIARRLARTKTFGRVTVGFPRTWPIQLPDAVSTRSAVTRVPEPSAKSAPISSSARTRLLPNKAGRSVRLRVRGVAAAACFTQYEGPRATTSGFVVVCKGATRETAADLGGRRCGRSIPEQPRHLGCHAAQHKNTSATRFPAPRQLGKECLRQHEG